ncbi:MAG: precorrin-6y C5,15-methyltransferase (decarboxylating) subunit CbiE [Oscillospiraceae bacterium]|nr:precorrin-6y C5,15-methyltransferase (decarboxylating) subunit CbiE [Oscillospiraceae bacterium]
MKQLTIVGVGVGPESVTPSARRAIERAQVLFGAPRLLQEWNAVQKTAYPHYTAAKITPFINNSDADRFALLVSGDVGFYSAAASLCRECDDIEVRMEPGISSLHYFFARLGRPWQDAATVSCHGRQANLVDTVRRSAATFILTGGNVPALGDALCRAGFSGLAVTVGQRLGMEDESITRHTAAELPSFSADPLTVLLIDNPAPDASCPTGIDDAAFIRGQVPMTKSAVRAVTMSKLRLQPGAVCCDVGAGTGSVTVEMALSAWRGHVYAIDKAPAAIDLIKQNCAAFHIGNVTPILGDALEQFAALPPMDAVFIGGSSGEMEALIAAAVAKNSAVRIVVNAIALETVQQAMAAFSAQGIEPEIVQLSWAETRAVSRVHMLTAQNPIFILSGGGAHE